MYEVIEHRWPRENAAPMEAKKYKYSFILKLTKDELEYLYKIVEQRKKRLFKSHVFHSENEKLMEKQDRREHFLLALEIKLNNKYMDLK